MVSTSIINNSKAARANKVEISFIIPTYNEQDNIVKTLSAINNYIHDISYEIIVIDNGSTDRTVEKVKEFTQNILVDDSKNISGLRNLGAKKAISDYLVFIDADVTLTETWEKEFKKTLLILRKERRIITGSRYGIREKPGWIEKYWFLPMTIEKPNYINGGHLIITKRIFWEIGGFDESLETGEDYDICERARKMGIEIVNNPTLRVVHEGYPKTIREFIRREIWHGIQDYDNFRSFFKSKPAILTALFWLTGLIGISLAIYEHSWSDFIICIAAILLLCLAAAINKRRHFPLNIFVYTLVYNLYFISRGLSLFNRVSRRLLRSTC